MDFRISQELENAEADTGAILLHRNLAFSGHKQFKWSLVGTEVDHGNKPTPKTRSISELVCLYILRSDFGLISTPKLQQ